MSLLCSIAAKRAGVEYDNAPLSDTVSFWVAAPMQVFVCTRFAQADQNEHKIQFAINSMDAPDPFHLELQRHGDIERALLWQERKPPSVIMREREMIVEKVVSAGERLWQRGACRKWYRGADEMVAKVAQTVNGPLLAKLCREVGFSDTECIEFFRQGALC